MLAHEALAISKKTIIQRCLFNLRSTDQKYRVLNEKELSKCKRDISVVLDAYIEDLKTNGTNNTDLIVSRFFVDGVIQLKTTQLEKEVHSFVLTSIINIFKEHQIEDDGALDHINHLANILLTAIDKKTHELNGSSPINELLRNRFTCRSFSDRPVEPEKLKIILDALEMAPCKQNNFPVQISVLGPGAQNVKDTLFYDSHCYPDYPNLVNPQLLAPIVFTFSKRRMEKLSCTPGTPNDLNPQHHAYEWVYNIQSGIFSTIICLTAESLGLNTGYVFALGEGKQAASLIGETCIEFAIGVGYAREDVNPRWRTRPQDPPRESHSALTEPRPALTDWVKFYGL